MKISVLYHSRTGNTKAVAEQIVEGMEQVEDVEARAFSIDYAEEDWLRESVCLVAGSPTYYASISGEMKLFLEKLGKYGVAGKLGGAFATADYLQGGAGQAVEFLIRSMLVKGMLVYSGGGSQGKPVIHLGPQAVAGRLEETEETFRLYGQRMAAKAKELFG